MSPVKARLHRKLVRKREAERVERGEPAPAEPTEPTELTEPAAPSPIKLKLAQRRLARAALQRAAQDSASARPNESSA